MSLCCLQTTYNITVTALNWFASYLCEKSFLFGSTASSLLRRVPQGSVLQLVLFRLYTTDVLALTENMQLHRHHTRTTLKICGFCAPAEASDLQQRMSKCVDRGSGWMQVNQPLLKLKSCGVRHLDNMTGSQTPHSVGVYTFISSNRLIYFKVCGCDFVIPYCHKIFTQFE